MEELWFSFDLLPSGKSTFDHHHHHNLTGSKLKHALILQSVDAQLIVIKLMARKNEDEVDLGWPKLARLQRIESVSKRV